MTPPRNRSRRTDTTARTYNVGNVFLDPRRVMLSVKVSLGQVEPDLLESSFSFEDLEPVQDDMIVSSGGSWPVPRPGPVWNQSHEIGRCLCDVVRRAPPGGASRNGWYATGSGAPKRIGWVQSPRRPIRSRQAADRRTAACRPATSAGVSENPPGSAGRHTACTRAGKWLDAHRRLARVRPRVGDERYRPEKRRRSSDPWTSRPEALWLARVSRFGPASSTATRCRSFVTL